MNSTTLQQARAAKPRIHDLLRDIPQLAGVGITRVDEGYAVKVNLSAPSDAAAPLPNEFEGVPIRIEIVGAISNQGTG